MKKAIILGNSLPHLKLIELLKSFDYYTILLDYNADSPARSFVDKHIVASALDKETVLEIAKSEDVSLVLSLSVDQAVPVACYVSEALLLPKLYSYETSLSLTNKALMKKVLKENNIPTTKFFIIKNTDDDSLKGILTELKFPIIIKPVDGTGSMGIEKLVNGDNLIPTIQTAMSFSRDKSVIVEEFFEGSDVSVDCFVVNGKAEVLMLREQYKINIDVDSGLQSIGSIVSNGSEDALYEKIQLIANKITRAFGIRNSPMLIQVLVNGNDINVVEIAGRIGGGTHVDNIKSATGFDIVKTTLKLLLNEKEEISYSKPTKLHGTHFLYANEGIFDKIVGLDELKDENIISDFYLMKARGSSIEKRITSKSRIAAFILSAPTKPELLQKIKCVIDKVDVIGLEGESIMNRELFIREK